MFLLLLVCLFVVIVIVVLCLYLVCLLLSSLFQGKRDSGPRSWSQDQSSAPIGNFPKVLRQAISVRIILVARSGASKIRVLGHGHGTSPLRHDPRRVLLRLAGAVVAIMAVIAIVAIVAIIATIASIAASIAIIAIIAIVATLAITAAILLWLITIPNAYFCASWRARRWARQAMQEFHL